MSRAFMLCGFCGFALKISVDEARLQVSTDCLISAKLSRVLTRNIFNQIVCQLQVVQHVWLFMAFISCLRYFTTARGETYQSRKQFNHLERINLRQ